MIEDDKDVQMCTYMLLKWYCGDCGAWYTSDEIKTGECEEFAGEFFESEASMPVGQPRTLLDRLPNVRWVFPSAPLLPSTRFGAAMSQWFDIWSVESPEEQAEIQKEAGKEAWLRRSLGHFGLIMQLLSSTHNCEIKITNLRSSILYWVRVISTA